jgi:hypothetical protein
MGLQTVAERLCGQESLRGDIPAEPFPRSAGGKDLDMGLFYPKLSVSNRICNFFKNNINSIISTRVRPRCM